MVRNAKADIGYRSTLLPFPITTIPPGVHQTIKACAHCVFKPLRFVIPMRVARVVTVLDVSRNIGQHSSRGLFVAIGGVPGVLFTIKSAEVFGDILEMPVLEVGDQLGIAVFNSAERPVEFVCAAMGLTGVKEELQNLRGELSNGP